MSKSALPPDQEKERFVREMFDRISPRYDLANRLLTLGLDQSWRRSMIEEMGLRRTQLVLDVACGTGDLLGLLKAKGLNPIGIDLSLGMLRNGRFTLPTVQGSALELPFSTKGFQGITCGFALRNFKSLPPVFSEFHRVLEPGGRLGILEVGTPFNPILRSLHGIYFNKLVPRIGGLISDREAYNYLPKSAAYLPSESGLRIILANAGFESISHRSVGFGAAQIYVCTRAEER